MRRSVVAVAILAGLPVSAYAQSRSWAAGVDGDWSTAANWSPADVPNTTGENALFSVGGTYVVTYDTTSTIGALTLINAGTTLVVDPGRSLTLTANSVNNGLIQLNPTTSTINSFLNAGANLSISGSGEIELAGGLNDAQLNTTLGGTLTNSVGHTISGSGDIGALMINEGLIRATDTGFGTQLRIQTNDKVNEGVMQAATGATLRISTLTIDQTLGGMIEADGGAVHFEGTSTVLGGTIGMTGAGGTVRRLGGGTTFFDDVTIDDDFIIDASGTVNVTSGGLTNNATIFVNNTTSSGNGVLNFLEDCAFDGTGTVLLGGGPNDSQLNTGTGIVGTNAAGHTIAGTGEINANLVNEGVVRASTTAFGTEMLLQSQNKTNNGTMQAATGATLTVGNIVITQAPSGVIEADGGEVEFTANASVFGGRLDKTGNGGVLRRIGGGSSLFDGVTVDADLLVAANGTLRIGAAGLTNNATIEVNNSSSSGNGLVTFIETAALGGAGTLLLGGGPNDSQLNTDVGVVGTNAVGHAIAGTGEINADLVNNGLIRASATSFGDEMRLQTSNKQNNGTMQAATGATLTIGTLTITQGPAGVIQADGGDVHFALNSMISGGTLSKTAMGGTLRRIGGGTSRFDGVTIDADLLVDPNSTVNITAGGITNNATIEINNTTSSGNGILNFLESATLDGTGSVLLAGGFDDARLTVTPGMIGTLGPNQTVTGSGDLRGDLALNGGTAPGIDGVGPLRIIDGNVTLSDTSVMTMQIAETGSANHGTLDVVTASTLVLDGTLALEFIDGFEPEIGDEFVFITSSSGNISGAFDTITVPGNIQRIRVTQTPNELRIGYTCLTDINGDFILNNTDINAFVSGFLNMEPIADINNDGNWNNTDINLFVQLFLGGCV